MWDRFGCHLWCLVRDCKNLWHEVLWEHQLKSSNECLRALERGFFIAPELGVEQTNWTLCKRILLLDIESSLSTSPYSFACSSERTEV